MSPSSSEFKRSSSSTDNSTISFRINICAIIFKFSGKVGGLEREPGNEWNLCQMERVPHRWTFPNEYRSHFILRKIIKNRLFLMGWVGARKKMAFEGVGLPKM